MTQHAITFIAITLTAISVFEYTRFKYQPGPLASAGIFTAEMVFAALIIFFGIIGPR